MWTLLFAELEGGDDIQASSTGTDCVAWGDDDVDAGGVGRLRAASCCAVVQGQGEVVIHKLSKDGGDLGGVAEHTHVSAELVAHLEMIQ